MCRKKGLFCLAPAWLTTPPPQTVFGSCTRRSPEHRQADSDRPEMHVGQRRRRSGELEKQHLRRFRPTHLFQAINERTKRRRSIFSLCDSAKRCVNAASGLSQPLSRIKETARLSLVLRLVTDSFSARRHYELAGAGGLQIWVGWPTGNGEWTAAAAINKYARTS